MPRTDAGSAHTHPDARSHAPNIAAHADPNWRAHTGANTRPVGLPRCGAVWD